MNSENKKENRRNLTRREFLSGPFKWVAQKSPEEPIPYRLPLDALRYIPKPDLMSIRPVLRHGWSVTICESGIEYVEEGGNAKALSLGPEYYAAVQYFNASMSLEQIATRLCSELEIDPDRSVSVVSEAFLTLAELEIYHPDTPLDPSAVLSAVKAQNA